MHKRILSFMLAGVVAFTSVPMNALAKVPIQTITEDNHSDIHTATGGAIYGTSAATGSSISKAGADLLTSGTVITAGYKYQTLTDGTISLTEYYGTGGALTIPSKIDGKVVSKIGANLFYDMDTYHNASMSKLPEMPTKITVENKSDLETSLLNKMNEKRIKDGKRPLVMDNTLKQVARYKSNHMIQHNYFDHKYEGKNTDDWLDTLKYPSRRWLENIGFHTDSSKLFTQWWDNSDSHSNMMDSESRSVGIGVYYDSVNQKYFATQIFSNKLLSNLTSAKIPFGVTEIGSAAFKGCTNLASVTIPSTVGVIADNAFDGCTYKNFKIRAPKDSYAIRYAVANAIPYQEITEKNPIKSIKLTEDNLTIEPGRKRQIEAVINPAGYNHLLQYKSDNPAVAAVSDGGMITALSEGTATITASIANVEAKVEVTVAQKDIKLEAITLNKLNLDLLPGEKERIAVRYIPLNTTESKDVTWTSSNPSIASVTGGAITALKGGKTIITAAVGTHTASCTVTVNADDGSIETPKLRAITNITKTLSDVVFSETDKGWSWRNPDTELKFSDSTKNQKFPAVYKNDAAGVSFTRELPVAVSTITGIAVSGSAIVEVNKELLLSAEPIYTGSPVSSEDYFIEWSINNSKASITQAGNSVRLEGKEKGTVKLTAVLKLRDRKNNSEPILYKKNFTVTITDQSLVETINITATEESESKGIYLRDGQIDLSYVSEAPKTGEVMKKDTFTLNVKTNIEASLKYSTSDSSVASIKKDRDGSTIVTINGAGVATLTVTANDKGKVSKSIILKCMDYTPRLETSVFTLHKSQTSGIYIPVTPAFGASLTEVPEIYDTMDAAVPSEKFDAFEKNGNYYLKIKNSAALTKSSYKNLRMDFETSKGTFSFNITVKLTEKAPSITIKQTQKPNLFYKDTAAVLNIQSSADIESIRQIVQPVTGKPYFVVDCGSVSGSSLSLTARPVALNSGNRTKMQKKVTFEIKFAGYKDDYIVQKAYTIPVSYTKPGFQVEPASTNIFYDLGNLKNELKIYNKTTKNAFDITSSGDISLKISNANRHISIDSVNTANDTLTVKTSKKSSASIRLQLHQDNWLEDVFVNHKVNISAKPVIKLSNTTITLNRNEAVQNFEEAEISAYVNGNSSIELEYLDTKGKTDASKALLTDNKLLLDYDEAAHTIKASFQKNLPAAGTYTYTVKGWIDTGSAEELFATNAATLTIKVVDREPAVSLSAKGSIQLPLRGTSSIIYTPKFSYVNGTADSVRLTGAYAHLFSAAVNNEGKIEIKAKNNTVLRTNVTYKLRMKITLDSGAEVESSEIKIKPKQTAVKTAASTTKFTFYTSAAGESFAKNLSFRVTKPEDVDIESITLTNYTGNFVYDDADNLLYLKDVKGLRGNKTYTLNFQIKYTDNADNAKPANVKVKVVLKK